MSSTLSSLDPHLLDVIVKRRLNVRLTTTASTVLLIYDWILTLGDEMELVWPSPWSAPKIMFLMNRYVGLMYSALYTILLYNPNETTARCKTAFDFQVWSVWLTIAIIELLLLVYVQAVYQLSRRTLIPLAGLYTLLATSSAIILGLTLPKEDVTVSIPGCVLSVSHDPMQIVEAFNNAARPRNPSSLLISLIPSVTYELFLLALLAFRAIVHYQPSARKANEIGVAAVLIRDSITYFIIIFVVYFTNAMIWTFASSQLFQVGVGFGISLPCLLGSRILLNLRSAHRRKQDSASSHIQTERWDYLFTATQMT